MSCDQYKEIISAMLDGEAEDNEKKQIDEHIRDCNECRSYLFEAAVVNRVLMADDLISLPSDIENNIKSLTIKKTSNSLFGLFSGHYRIPRGLVWIGGFLLILSSFTSLSLTVERGGPTESVTIQPVDNILTVQKIVIDESDIISNNSIRGNDPI